MRMFKRLTALLLTLPMVFTLWASALTTEEALGLLETYYIDELPAAAYEAQTVEELVESLGDPYTEYLSAEEYSAFNATMTDQRMVGLGVTCTLTEEGVLVDVVYPDSAAHLAGLVPGDMLLTIDGVSVAGITTEEFQALAQGEKGSTVLLDVLRADGSTMVLSVVRREFTIPATQGEMLDETTCYITCTTFGAETYGHFTDIISTYDDAADCWIVDLRANSGGNMQAAVDAASAFAGPGQLAYLVDGSGAAYYYSSANDSLTLDPVIVLVGEHTASAAELFATAVRDRTAGIVIGGRTYGKGVAQLTLDSATYPDLFTDDAFKITAYRFFSASYITTDRIGVIPHLLVSEDNAAPLAYLLCADAPVGDCTGSLRLNLGHWRIYVNLELAVEEYYLPAFEELLSALPPDTPMFLGGLDNSWTETSREELAASLGLNYVNHTFSDLEESDQDTVDYGYAIELLATFGLVDGPGDGTFLPEAELDRASFCALLVKALGYEPVEGESPFPDVTAEDWYAPYVNALYYAGVVNGADDGLFHPEAPMDHQQFFTMLGRAAANLNYMANLYLQEGMDEETAAGGVYDGYDPWARDYVWLLDGLFHDDAFNIDPYAPTLRKEAAYALACTLVWVGVLPG